MNTTEKIVEAYFRLCKKCFTLPDVKVIKGNNRQIDLLAYNIKSSEQFHIETSVTHRLNWCPTANDLISKFNKKFFGSTLNIQRIYNTYERYGFNPKKINRIWVCWAMRDKTGDFQEKINKYCRRRQIQKNPIKVICFRDAIIPALENEVSTAHYEDDSLRTLSLLKQYKKQRELRKIR